MIKKIKDAQPTSRHFSTIIHDDIVTEESVTTKDQIDTITKTWLAADLGVSGERGLVSRYKPE